MEVAVYVDILFILNTYVNFFLLLATRKLSGYKSSKYRILAGAAAASVISIIIFFLKITFVLSIFVKLATACITTVIVFGKKPSIKIFKTTFMFFTVSFIFSGIMVAMIFAFSPTGLLVKNGIVYFDISAIFLIISTIICYVSISLYHLIIKRKNSSQNDVYDITITVADEQIKLIALRDTGNSLCDTISGDPVIVCEYSAIYTVIPQDVREVYKTSDTTVLLDSSYKSDWKSRFRMIPYNVVGSSGVLPCFIPDEVKVIQNGKTYETTKTLVAVSSTKLSDGDYNAIFNSDLIHY